MERRIISKKSDKDGDITHIYGNNWGLVTVQDAIFQIEHNLYQYYVDEAGYRSDVYVEQTPWGRKFIKTYADRTSKNNLDNLPEYR